MRKLSLGNRFLCRYSHLQVDLGVQVVGVQEGVAGSAHGLSERRPVIAVARVAHVITGFFLFHMLATLLMLDVLQPEGGGRGRGQEGVREVGDLRWRRRRRLGSAVLVE